MRNIHVLPDGQRINLDEIQTISNIKTGIGFKACPFLMNKKYEYTITFNNGNYITRSSDRWNSSFWSFSDKNPLLRDNILNEFKKEWDELIKEWTR